MLWGSVTFFNILVNESHKSFKIKMLSLHPPPFFSPRLPSPSSRCYSFMSPFVHRSSLPVRLLNILLPLLPPTALPSLRLFSPPRSSPPLSSPCLQLRSSFQPSIHFLLFISSSSSSPSRLMETAREMIRESLPIKCLEAVILGMYPFLLFLTYTHTHTQQWAKRLFCYLWVKSMRHVALMF